MKWTGEDPKSQGRLEYGGRQVVSVLGAAGGGVSAMGAGKKCPGVGHEQDQQAGLEGRG